MKRSWTTTLLGVGLALLLAHIAVLQWHMFSSASLAEAERSQRRVNEQADRFASDFNREVQGAYFNFQIDADAIRGDDATVFNQRYDLWQQKAQYASLVSGFYIWRDIASVRPPRYDPTERRFVSMSDIDEASAKFVSEPEKMGNIDAKNLLLYLPLYERPDELQKIVVHRTIPDGPPEVRMPKPYAYLVLKLDEATIRDRIIPDLTAKYFADGDYRVAVTDKAGALVIGSLAGEDRDSTANLFDLSPDKMMMFASKESLPRVAAGDKTVVFNSRVENHSIVGSANGTEEKGNVRIEIKGDTEPRTAVLSAHLGRPGDTPWTLGVQHVDGSLQNYVHNRFRRNILLGFGLLFLVGAAVAGLIYSSYRAKKFARRQIEFVSSVTHEFRTPLAVIYSAGENLADGVARDTKHVSGYGELIKGEGRKLTSMVEQILDFAGADSGKRKFTFTATRIEDVIDAAIADCKPLIDEKEIEVTRNIATLSTINADGAALTQAIQNLIANAVKYSNGSKRIGISASNGDGRVCIVVEDEGIGISRGDLRQIFDPFYRSKEVVDAQIHGNGLGLALVKQIVEAHGGKVSATSELGKGSIFTIELKSEPPA